MEYNLRKIIGLIIWWTEGAKLRKDGRWKNSASYPVEISSTDPVIIKNFIEFLKKDVGIDEKKLRLQLHLCNEHDEHHSLRMWSWLTKIPVDQFQKSIIRSSKNSSATFGSCKVRYSSKEIYLKIDQMLQNLLKLLEN